MQSVDSLPQLTPGTAPDDRVFRALADPNRRRLLDRLHEKSGQTLGELCKGLTLARQSVSQHLEFLEQANLVTVQWQGRQKRHFINPVPIHTVYHRWVRKFETQTLEAPHGVTNIER